MEYLLNFSVLEYAILI